MATLTDAHYWRDQGYQPHRLVDDQAGNELELISYPWPEDEGVYIYAREYNNSDTIKKYMPTALSALPQGMTPRELRRRIDHLAGEIRNIDTLKSKTGFVADLMRYDAQLKRAKVQLELATNELGEKQVKLAPLLLEYSDARGSPLYKLGSSWYAFKNAEMEMVKLAIEELRNTENRNVPNPLAITDDMVQEIRRLRVNLMEWVS